MRERIAIKKMFDTQEVVSFIVLNIDDKTKELKSRSLELLTTILKDHRDDQNLDYSNIHYLLNYLAPERYTNSLVNMVINTINGEDAKFELINNLYGVFRKDEKIRKESWCFLINEKIIEWLFDTEKELHESFGKIKDDYTLTDPFKDFMDDSDEITYKSSIFPDMTNSISRKNITFEDPIGMKDLLDISRNTNIENAIRQSSLDQLIVYIVQHSGSAIVKKFIEQNFDKCLNDFLRFGSSKTFYEIFNNSTRKHDELVEAHRSYLTRLAAMISCMFMAPVFNSELRVEIVNYLFSSKIVNQFLKNVVLLMTNLHKETRYQGFFLANLIFLGNVKINYFLCKGIKLCKSTPKAVETNTEEKIRIEEPFPFNSLST